MKKSVVMFLLSSLVATSIVVPTIGCEINNVKNDDMKVKSKEATISSGVIKKSSYNKSETTVTINKKRKPVDKQLKYKYCWVSASLLNVRKEPNKKSDVIDKLPYNTKVKAAVYNKHWMILKDGGYISRDFISKKEIDYLTYSMPYTSGYKSFMPYNLFSNKSNQGKLQLSCYTGNYGIRQYDSRYCVALGSYFNVAIGQYFDLVLDNGTVIPCIMADQKADCDTDSENIVTVANGCATEFIVDFSSLYSAARRMGDISYCNENW